MTAGLQMPSPLGTLWLSEAGGRLTGLSWTPPPVPMPPSPLLYAAKAQLLAYFAGQLGHFDLPLDWGTGLQEKVRRAMAAIPFGETLTYGQIARTLGAPAQAVGQACGANPLPILIPCHRVRGARGLGGFSARGGVETKVWLLRHEGAAGLLL